MATGDLLVNGIANLVDGYVNEWPDALEKLRAFDFVDVVSGHGDPFKGKERIDWFQAYYGTCGSRPPLCTIRRSPPPTRRSASIWPPTKRTIRRSPGRA